MKKTLQMFIGGARSGALFYLLSYLVMSFGKLDFFPLITVRNILAILLMSGMMGILTRIFDVFDSLAYAWQIVMHFWGTLLLLLVTCFVMDWTVALRYPLFWIVFFTIYILVWLYQLFLVRWQTRKINHALHLKRQVQKD